MNDENDEDKFEESVTNNYYSGPHAHGGGAKSSQFVFTLLDTKNERIIIYVCLTIVAVFWIIWR